jgi:chemotaxis protein methyltransferase CheR
MLLLESGAWWRDWQVEILGSDINQRVLHTARKGVYKKTSHRVSTPEMINKYFVEEGREITGSSTGCANSCPSAM